MAGFLTGADARALHGAGTLGERLKAFAPLDCVETMTDGAPPTPAAYWLNVYDGDTGELASIARADGATLTVEAFGPLAEIGPVWEAMRHDATDTAPDWSEVAPTETDGCRWLFVVGDFAFIEYAPGAWEGAPFPERVGTLASIRAHWDAVVTPWADAAEANGGE